MGGDDPDALMPDIAVTGLRGKFARLICRREKLAETGAARHGAYVIVRATVTALLVLRVRCEVCGRPFWAARRSAQTCSAGCRQNLSRTLRATTPPLPAGPFQLIYADPPWRFTTRSPKGQGRSPEQHYRTMIIDSIRRLPVKKIAAADCGLAIWVYGPLLPEVLEVIQAWRFEYKSDLLTWVKTTSAGQPVLGTGYTTRKGSEQLLYATRGKGLQVVDHAVRQVLQARRREHSRKPDEAVQALERLFGPVSRIELFARDLRPEWVSWGNECLPS